MVHNNQYGNYPRADYVRFIKGTPTAWDALAEKDPNTLYFISEKSAENGLLYLGDKLISGAGTVIIQQGSSKKIGLNNLTDVELDINISDGSVLTYDAKKKKWVNKQIKVGSGCDCKPSEPQPNPPVEIELPEVFIGATDFIDGTSGLVPMPRVGDNELFLKGDGTWADPNSAIRAEIMALRQGDTGSIRAIAASEILKIYGKDVPNDYNTIEKIAKWIIQKGVSIDSQDGANRLEALEKAVYGDDKTSTTSGLIANQKNLIEIVINGTEESPSLVSSVKDLRGNITAVNNSINILQKQYNSINKTVIDLDSRLTWQKY